MLWKGSTLAGRSKDAGLRRGLPPAFPNLASRKIMRAFAAPQEVLTASPAGVADRTCVGADNSSSAMAAVAAVPGPASAAAVEGGQILPREVLQQFPSGEFSVELQVRDAELDQFNVVNNAVYLGYLQHARHEAFFATGRDVDSYARAGTPLALSQLNISFRAPLRSRDRFRVTVAVTQVTAARVVMHQRILKRVPQPACSSSSSGSVSGSADGGDDCAAASKAPDEQLVAEAEAVVVFLDSQYRAARIPRDAARVFKELAGLRAASK